MGFLFDKDLELWNSLDMATNGEPQPGATPSPETSDNDALDKTRNQLADFSSDGNESKYTILYKTSIANDPTQNEMEGKSDKEKDDAERSWAERIGGHRLNYDPRKRYETASDDPRFKQLVEATSLRYLETQDRDFFHKDFSGAVSDSGNLMDNSEKETVFFPSQNVPPTGQEEVNEKAKSDFQRLYPDAAEGYEQSRKYKENLNQSESTEPAAEGGVSPQESIASPNPDISKPDFGPLEGITFDKEAFEQQINESKIKVDRYLSSRLTGVDGKRLPKDALTSAAESLRHEVNDRVGGILGKNARGEPVIPTDALDTFILSAEFDLLKVVSFDIDALNAALDDPDIKTKIDRYALYPAEDRKRQTDSNELGTNAISGQTSPLQREDTKRGVR